MMTPDRRSRRAVALPAGPVPTADQSPSQGNKGIISLNHHDSSNCLPVSTHPDVRRVFNEPPKKKTPRSSSRNPGQIRFRGFRPHFSAADRTAFVRLFTLARGHARSSSILFNPPIFRGGTRKFQPISARDLFRFPSLDGCERGLVRDSVHVPRRSTRTARFRRGLVRVPKRACARRVAHNSARSAGRERARAPPSR